VREFVLNDACLGGPSSLEQVAALAADVEQGINMLIGARQGVQTMRLAASPGEVEVAGGVTLAEVLTHLIRTTKVSGRVLARMATKYPVEDDLDDGELAALINWTIPAYHESLSLVLCAHSRRISVTISEHQAWMVDPLRLYVMQDHNVPNILVEIEIDNIYSKTSAADLSKRLDKEFVDSAAPADIWRNRAHLFPDLEFAPRVERDLANLASVPYEAALTRLGELNRVSSAWTENAATPTYLSKVTGESKPTMDKYGTERIFRSCNGSNETFEKHARLPNGFRLHLREIPSIRRLEIGYIGPHLSIVREN
jgi:hypothetical protein